MRTKAPKQAAVVEGRRKWMTRGLQVEHHDRLRKVAAFMPGGTIQAAHDLVLDAGLPIIEQRLGIPSPAVVE